MPKYFFLGGKILKARGPRSYFQNSNHKKAILSNSIVLLWYLRPDMSFFTSVCLLKLTGKGNRIPELDNLYRNNRDMNLLPDIYQKISEFISTKQIAR